MSILFNRELFTMSDLDNHLDGKNKDDYVIKITPKQFHNLYGQIRGHGEIVDMYDGFKIEIIKVNGWN